MTLPAAVVSILLHRESNLLGVVCDDMLVRILDIETKRVVRELGGFNGRILDIVNISLVRNCIPTLTGRLGFLPRFTMAGG